MTTIMVVKEKHGTYYYDASTPEALAAASLELLKERWEEGYWYPHPDEIFTSKYYSRDVIEDVESLPESLQDEARRQNQRAKENRREYDTALDWYKRAKHVVETGENPIHVHRNGRSYTCEAWDLLTQRRDCEYEGIALEEVKSA